jgi:hypothetical protein
LDNKNSGRMMKIFIVILIVFAATACQNHSQLNDKSLVVFELTKLSTNEVLKLSDLNVKNVDYIPLETKDASLFSEIRKLIVSGNDIYINDYQNTFLRFGSDGRFQNRFNRQGRGPQEYGDSYNFTIDPDYKDIYVCSITDKKIYNYTNQGEFLNSFHAPEGTLTINFSGSNILCHRPYLSENTESYLVMVNKKGVRIEEFPAFKYKTSLNSQYGYINEIVWFNFNDELYIKDIHSDTVYLLKNKKLIPHFVIDYDGRIITPEVRSQFNSLEAFLNEGAKHVVELSVWRIGDYIISIYMYDTKIFIYAGEIKGNKEHLAYLQPGIINDIDGGPNLFYHTLYYFDDNTLLAWINACDLMAHVKSNAFKNSTPIYPEEKKELEQLANSLNENDNPVLMMVKLKN